MFLDASICLFVCDCDNSKSNEWPFMTFYIVRTRTKENVFKLSLGFRSYSGYKKFGNFKRLNFQCIFNDFGFLINITSKIMSESF